MSTNLRCALCGQGIPQTESPSLCEKCQQRYIATSCIRCGTSTIRNRNMAMTDECLACVAQRQLARLSANELQHLCALQQRGHTIQAIKTARELLNISLKHAIDVFAELEKWGSNSETTAD